MRVTWLLLVTAAIGCRTPPKQCDQLAEIAIRCDKDHLTGDARAQAKDLTIGFCRNAYAGFGDDADGSAGAGARAMNDEIKRRAECATRTATCDDWAKCK